MIFDKERLFKIAVTWIFLLKANRLVGKKSGYPSSTTYLMMFINYCQTIYELPNLQTTMGVDEATLETYNQTEKLS